MTRYYFDAHDDETLVPDDDGVECSDLEEAGQMAAVALAELAVDVLPACMSRVLRIDVREGDRVLLKTRLTYEAARV